MPPTWCEIDASVSRALTQFNGLNAKNKELAGKAVGMLVFPCVAKRGLPHCSKPATA